MNRTFAILGVAGGLLVAVLVVYGWGYLFRPKTLSADALEKIALEDSDAGRRQQAAMDLATMGIDGLPNVRRVLHQSTAPEVRAAVIPAVIQNCDWESVPLVLGDLDNPSALVRALASAVVIQMLCFDPSLNPNNKLPVYDPNAPTDQRHAAIEEIRKHWAKMKDKPVLEKKRQDLETRLKNLNRGS